MYIFIMFKILVTYRCIISFIFFVNLNVLYHFYRKLYTLHSMEQIIYPISLNILYSTVNPHIIRLICPVFCQNRKKS